MSSYISQDRIRITVIREKVGLLLWWKDGVGIDGFGHMWRRLLEAPIRRVEWVGDSQIVKVEGDEENYKPNNYKEFWR